MEVLTTNQSRLLYEFGPFQLDPAERLLSRNGDLVTLTPKAFDTLVALVENGGRLLEKELLLKTVWAETFVDENTLASNISALRKALGQSKGEQYIETVPKRGYRFVADVRKLNLEAGDLLVRKRSRSRIVINELSTPNTDRRLFLPSFKTKRILLASLLLIVIIGAALVWTSNRKAARAVAARQEAYQDYLEGRARWNERTGEGLFKSISCFERAIARDPNFALGYAGLADAYAFDYEHWRKAEALANKAIELDGTLAEPRATLGFLRTFWQWDWADAEAEFKRAIELNANYATAHQWYAIGLASQARLQSAKVEMQRALDLDPSSLPMRSDMAQILYFAREYDRGVEACKEALKLDSDFINAHKYLYYLYQIEAQDGTHPEVVEEFFKVKRLSGGGLFTEATTEKTIREAYAAGGMRGFWKAILDVLNQLDHFAYEKAEYYSLLGEREQAFYWLEKAFEWHNFDFLFMNVEPAFDGLRKDPRFDDLFRRSGLVSSESAR